MIPPLLPPHPSSLAAAVHDCLFSIFTVNPHFRGPFGYPQPVDALGSCSSLLAASSLAASLPIFTDHHISMLCYPPFLSRWHRALLLCSSLFQFFLHVRFKTVRRNVANPVNASYHTFTTYLVGLLERHTFVSVIFRQEEFTHDRHDIPRGKQYKSRFANLLPQYVVHAVIL